MTNPETEYSENAAKMQQTDDSTSDRMTPTMRKFAAHFAVNGDPIEAYRAAYPASHEWLATSISAAACRLRQNPGVMDIIAQVRLPIIKELQLDFDWVLKEAARHYYAASLKLDHETALRALRLIHEMTKDRPGYRRGDTYPGTSAN